MPQVKYLVIESSSVNGAMANAVTVKESYDEARMLWHQVRASQLANSNVTYGLAMIVDETGRLYENEYHGSTAVVDAQE